MTPLAVTTGEELATSGAWNGSASALASATVRPEVAVVVARRNRPPSVGAPLTSSTLLPSWSIWFSTAAEDPVPTAISTITEPTPIISPRIVSPDRSLFAARPASATRTVSITGRAPRSLRR